MVCKSSEIRSRADKIITINPGYFVAIMSSSPVFIQPACLYNVHYITQGLGARAN